MLRQNLSDFGVSCWIDKEGIGAGEDWTEEIGKALRQVYVLVLVYSSNSIESENVKDELAIAAKRALAIVPVRIEDIDPSPFFEMRLARYNWTDIFEMQQDKLRKIAEDIKIRVDKEKLKKNISTDSLLPNMSSSVKEPVAKLSSNEEKYNHQLEKAYEDGIITPEERAKLEGFREAVDISPERAQELENPVASKYASIRTVVQEGESDSPVTTPNIPTDSAKRITYADWSEFENAQGSNPKKKPFLPVAKSVHDLLIASLNENNLSFDVRYGDGTFSISVSKERAKSGKRTCARFGLLDLRGKCSYLESLYKAADDPLPTGADYWKKDILTQYSYNFYLDPETNIQELVESIKGAILRSYGFLSKTR